MQTLARELGVSRTTISLALRDHPSISAATIVKVKKLAKELNYRLDPAISANAASHWRKGIPSRFRKVALLSYRSSALKENQVDYLQCTRRQAAQSGYEVEPFYVNDYEDELEMTAELSKQGIRGLLISPLAGLYSSWIVKMDWSRFTAVCCGGEGVRFPLHTVTSDVFTCTRLLWQRAMDAGFKRIGVLLHRCDQAVGEFWRQMGASIGMELFHGVEESQRIPIMIEDDGNQDAVNNWYSKYRPEIIIGSNPSVARTLCRTGVSIPQDAELLLVETDMDSCWSGFSNASDLVARSAVDFLVAEICNNHWGIPALPQLVMIVPEWNTGTSFTRKPSPLDVFCETGMVR